ncbi:hypothetical protein [Lentzea sp. NPDC092896]
MTGLCRSRWGTPAHLQTALEDLALNPVLPEEALTALFNDSADPLRLAGL